MSKAKRKHWTSLSGLYCKANFSCFGKMCDFLEEKGLIDETSEPTEKAWSAGFVRMEGDKIRWSVRRYIHLIQSSKKLAKLKAHGKPIHPMVYKRALEHPVRTRYEAKKAE